MFLTRKHLSRRTLLKGAGISLALPLLDAMVPAALSLPNPTPIANLHLTLHEKASVEQKIFGDSTGTISL